MGFDLTRPLLLGAGAIAIGIVVFTWWRLAPPLPPGRARLSLGLRVLIVLLLTGALAGFELQTSPPEQTLMVVADLSASRQSALDKETALVRQILAARQGSDRTGVVSFGRDPQVEVGASTDPQFADFQSRLNPNYTDLASALQLAGSILPNDTRRHIVIVSDGRANLGDAVAEARLLHAEGVRVDAVALAVPIGAEAYVDRVAVPDSINQGQQAPAQAVIVSNGTTQATVRWYLDRTLLSTALVDLAAGETTLNQTVRPASAGFHSVQVTIDPVLDTYAENNVGEALIQVIGPPHVLLVEQSPGDAPSLEAALASTGILATVVAPGQLPKTAADLAAYQSVVLVNVPAESLGADGMALMQAATRDLGTGLVVIGGTDSYGPGGYAGTALETTLPVQIQLPQNMQKPPVAVMLVLETAESTSSDQVVRGAANAVIDQLTARDYVGVTNGMQGNIVIPLTQLTDKAKIKSQIAAMSLGDPPGYGADLNVAASQLEKSNASLKHIILLGDGDAMNDNYATIVPAIHQKGITVSAVAAGSLGTDAATMQQIASLGHGRFYQSNGIQDVPQIFLKETSEALKPWIVEGTIQPHLASLLEALPGVQLTTFPALTGYVATTPRAAADVILQSPTGDPLLATWQYGLGRVMAWTSDSQGRWTAALLRSPDANRFFGDIVRYTQPQAGDPALRLETQVRGDRTHMLVTAPAISGSAVTVSAVAPDLSGAQLTLTSTGPGRFEGDLPTDQVGSYLLHVSQSAGGVARHANTFGLVVPYSPEYRDLGTDAASLRAVADAGGGILVSDPAQVYRLPVPASNAALPLDELLLVLAVILFPLDVALRRLILRVEDVPAWRQAFTRKPAKATPANATVARLQERVTSVRSERAARSAKGDPKPQEPKPPETTPEKSIEQLRARRRR
ncbi:MAG TPA: VWA domain-containing protein [Candidatus Limnocylindrales bacterium]|nr:VWA domain-containing protein [Candidatus Limnocylindrales bacterium]